jgi:cysteinyl-tRNA synthetase
MPIKFYNTLTRSLDEFTPLHGNTVSFYSCGPTVYNKVHIGNLRAFSFYDLLKRYLRFRGFDVCHVMNITDVEDKIIKHSQAQGKSLKEFTEYYTQLFLEDLKALDIQAPNIMPKATEEIDGMVELIELLISKDYAYKNEQGDVYFRIAKDPNYGRLARIDLSSLRQNADGRMNSADEYEKDDLRDFALWKAYDPKTDGDVFWDTRIGKGRPGWHIECSAMAAKYLGQPFDIHTGGVDLCFPHHTNEIAQSECAYEKPFAKYWMHVEHLIVDGKKMSKSAGNFFTLSDLLERKISPRALRFELLKTHYRQQLDFRIENMSQNLAVLSRFDELADRLKHCQGTGWAACEATLAKSREDFSAAMDNDLNVPAGLTVLIDLSKEINRNIESQILSSANAQLCQQSFAEYNQVFGFLLPTNSEEALPAEVQALVDTRSAAKAAKDYAAADAARDEILRLGYEIKDTPQGVRCRKREA